MTQRSKSFSELCGINQESNKEFYDKLIDYLQREDLHESNYLRFIKAMSKRFSNWEDKSLLIFQELDFLCQEEPEFITHSIKSFCFNTKLMTTILRMGGKYQDTSSKQIPHITLECIAIGYEAAPILCLPAYLLSKRKQPIENLAQPLSILKHFHSFGLKKQDIDNMRKIRNSLDHEFTINGKNLVSYGW